MPKELVRKRGRRAKKSDKEEYPLPETAPEPVVDDQVTESQAGPSSQPYQGEGAPSRFPDGKDPAAPFGYVDPDIKAYFKSVDEKLREWEEIGLAPGEGEESELEDRTNFLHSALSEVRGMELTLATDGDCALIMERLLHSMGDWGRRVLADSFRDSWDELLQHRFGSHVCQTLFSLAAETIDREQRGIFPKQQEEQEKDFGEENARAKLSTMGQIIMDMCQHEMKNKFHTMLNNPHASPPLRLLFILISKHKAMPDAANAERLIRSNRSTKFRSHQGGKMKSIFGGSSKMEGEAKTKGRRDESREVPAEFEQVRSQIRQVLQEKISGTEWRALGVDAVGGPMAQILLEIEADGGEGGKPHSILDHLTFGLVTAVSSGAEKKAEDYIPSLLRDSTGSHLLEAMLTFAPIKIFHAMWELYFKGKIGKMASHPIANFVTAAGIKRLDDAGIENVVAELQAVGTSNLTRTSRLAVLKAMVDYGVAHPSSQAVVNKAVCDAFELETAEEKLLLVPCALTLNVVKMYRKATKAEAGGEELPEEAEAEAEEQEEEQHGWKPRQPKPERKPLEPNMQGSLLLQAMMGFSAPANETVLNSLTSLSLDEMLKMAHNPIACHVLESALRSKSVGFKYRKKLLQAFMGNYVRLVDDRCGSRVGDTIWDAADGFTKEKIARSLIPDSIKLSNSQYGRFFARKLNLHLLERRPDEWREAQLGLKHHFAHEREAAQEVEQGPGKDVDADADAENSGDKKRKRKRDKVGQDDPATAVIDDLFGAVIDKKKGKKSKTE